jgi:RNA polymerase sigma-70 factor (ECF subfamily)
MFRNRDRLIAEIPHLRRYARVLARGEQEADDLVQACLERALRKIHLWQTEGKLRSWLFSIMHNMYIDRTRTLAHGRPAVALDDVAELSQTANQEDSADVSTVLAAVQRLPRDLRDVLVLVAIQELSYAEAALALGIPVGTLMSRLHRARERLRESLGMEKPRAVLRQVK